MRHAACATRAAGTVAFFVALAQRCSDAFIVMPSSGGVVSVPQSRGSSRSSSRSIVSSSIVSRSSNLRTNLSSRASSIAHSGSDCLSGPRDIRLERLATLGRVHWRGFSLALDASRTSSTISASTSSFHATPSKTTTTLLLPTSKSHVIGGSRSDEMIYPNARAVGSLGMDTGRDDRGWGLKGSVQRARRAVGRVLRRRGASPSAQSSAAASAAAAAGAGLSRGPQQGHEGTIGKGGGAGDGVASTNGAVDIDDVLRQSRLLLKDNQSDRSKRILILMSDTGGGHRASAEALKAAFEELYPGAVDVDIVDLWTAHAPWPFNKFVEAYQFMAKRPPIWKAFWEYGRFPPTRRITDELTNMQCHRRFRSMLEDQEPDLVISVHPLCQQVPMRVMKKMGDGARKIPFVTVVTDLGGAHPTWFHKEVDACFVPSERLAHVARNCGLAPAQIRLHGLPIRPSFWGEQSAKADLQEKLGLKPGVKACLVVGGGDGVGGLQGIADSVGQKLGQETAETQVVVVCGTNNMVKTSLEKGDWASNVHVHVKGFVSNMDEWMGAVDCIITKAGPGTIAEAMVRGLPIMLSTFLPGQEAGNVPYVTEGGFGSYSKDPSKIADTISSWLRDDKLLAEMSSKAREASRPKATYQICRDIGEMLFSKAGESINLAPQPAFSAVNA